VSVSARRTRGAAVALAAAALALPAAAQVAGVPRMARPAPVAEGADPLNAAMHADLAPGLVLTVRITARGLAVDDAALMLIPARPPTRGLGPGPRVIAVGYSGGREASRTDAADPYLVIDEGRGPVWRETRTTTFALPAPVRLDIVELAVTETGQHGRFDARPVFRAYCAAAPAAPLCRPRQP
jgi:hypothetical protein